MEWIPTNGGVNVKVIFHPLIEPGKMVKVHSFPMQPEVHFSYEERYKIAFKLYDTLEESFPMIQSIARMELQKILDKYK